MIDLSGKHIYIAGGSRGIGAASAILAAKAGANVSISYVSNEKAAQAVVSEIVSNGKKAFAVKADISDAAQATQAVDTAVEILGPLNGAVVSAGIFEGCEIENMTAEFWDRTMDINLRPQMLTRHC